MILSKVLGGLALLCAYVCYRHTKSNHMGDAVGVLIFGAGAVGFGIASLVCWAV